jgi:L-2-hydroxyglutarate oxidase LhgO
VELGGARWPGIGGVANELGRLEVGDRVDSRGPTVRGTRERRPARKARTKRENIFPVKTRSTHGLGGPAGTVLACGGSEASVLAGPEAEWAARSARPKIRKKEFLN